MKMTVFIKTMKIHYVSQGIHENPETRITKKRAQQQKAHPEAYRSYTRIFIKSSWDVHKSQAKTSEHGPPGSTIIIFKEIIRFNNNNNHLTHGTPRFLPPRSSPRRGLPPPLRGGNSQTKESPVLPIPRYPALRREDTTSWNNGRPRLNNRIKFLKFIKLYKMFRHKVYKASYTSLLVIEYIKFNEVYQA